MADDSSQPPGWPFNEVPDPPLAPLVDPPATATPPPGAPRFEPPAPVPAQPPAAPTYPAPAPGQPPPPAPGYAPPPPAGVQPPPPTPGYAAPPAQGYQPPPANYPPPAQGYQPPPANYPPQQQPYASPYEPPVPGQPPAPQQYASPPGWSPTAPPKKSRKSLWVTLAVIFGVLALGIGSCTFWFIGTVKAPVDESNRFLAAIDQGDYAAAAAMTDPLCNGGLTANSLANVFAGEDIDYNLNNSSIVNSSATVSGSFSQGTASYRSIELELRKRGDDWRVCSFFRS